jgi:RNA polymerase sigma-70 factor, ECF subfamily
MDFRGTGQAPSVDEARATAGPEPASPAALAFFRALFEREIPYVWTSLHRLGIAERDCEDLASEVFFRVYQRLDHYDSARPLRPWLFAFAVRVASEHRRLARNRYEELGGADDAALLAVAPGKEEREDAEIVRIALGTLDIDKRAVLVMHDLDGHSVPEVAQALSIPEGTAYSRLRSGREQLTQAIRRQKRREK